MGDKITHIPTITAKEDYEFIGWLDQGNKVDPTTYRVDTNMMFTAEYKKEIKYYYWWIRQ